MPHFYVAGPSEAGSLITLQQEVKINSSDHGVGETNKNIFFQRLPIAFRVHPTGQEVEKKIPCFPCLSLIFRLKITVR